MSRRKSIAVNPPVQSRLLTIVAGLSPLKSRNREIWLRSRSTHSATVSLELSTRSPDIRGSPIMPVAPPTSGSTRCPASCRWRSTTSCTRWPWCRLGAVGSKPQYRVTGPAASASRSAARSVVCATRPRHWSSSRMSVTVSPSSPRGSSGLRAAPVCPVRRRGCVTFRCAPNGSRRGPVRGHGRVAGDPPPPREPLRVSPLDPDADARPALGRCRRGGFAAEQGNPAARLGHVLADRREVQPERDGEARRTAGQIVVASDRAGSKPPRSGELNPIDDLTGPEQHAGRRTGHVANDVHTVVQAEVSIDVEPTGLTEHRGIARAAPSVRVRDRVVRPRVGLDLGDPDRYSPPRAVGGDEGAE